MKKFFVFCLVCLASFFMTTTTLAEPDLRISFQEWDSAGSFDYTLYYPYSSQVISKVRLPQNQRMTILKAEYTLDEEKSFIKLQLGKTGAAIKGRGSDSDWRNTGSDTLTDYGELDAYGRQSNISIHFETVLIKNQVHQANLLLGWVQQETVNELKNIVYHLDAGEDVGDQSQPDNGSRLDGVFRGLLVGINDELFIAPDLILTTGLNVLILNAKAYGHWANHDPAWNWENEGRAVGYGANIGMKYGFNSNIQAELCYYYNHVKAIECSEILNGSLLAQLVDLEYEQKGWRAGLVILF